MVFGVPTVAELREAERRFLADNFDLGFAGGLLHRGRGDGLRLLFDYIREFQAQVAGICGKGHASLQINDARAEQLIEFAIEVLHAFGRAVAHGVHQGFAFAFPLFDVLARAQGG